MIEFNDFEKIIYRYALNFLFNKKLIVIQINGYAFI